MNNIRQSRVPAGRLSRMLRLGRLAGGVAGTAVGQGIRQWSSGQRPSSGELWLNPANAQRLTAQLSQMRGAVLKIGQLLSMEAGDLLPAELTDILAELRDSADAMPEDQLFAVLEANLGTDWRQRFSAFETRPFAAASIGQVHNAVDTDGRRLAVKVQYPGVATSIDSDIDNVAMLFNLLRLLPSGLDIDALLEIARRQLHDEADYQKEAICLRRYRARLGPDPVFRVPDVIDALSARQVLTMEFIQGGGIERMRDLPAARRDWLASRMINLTLKEFLHWGLVQSAP